MTGRGSIVLSYARQDRALARRLHRRLSFRGFDVWVDWENVEGHAPWMPQVLGAIESAGCVVLVLSAYALRSPNCRLELDHARRCGKPVLYFAAPALSTDDRTAAPPRSPPPQRRPSRRAGTAGEPPSSVAGRRCKA